MARYVIFEGSFSGHCCFEFSVMDTTKPEIDGDGELLVFDGQACYETICECFTKEDAETVCAALNSQTPGQE